MAGGAFVIEELSPSGADNPSGERFEWTAKNRAIPKRPWTTPAQQRTVRTDYPGAKEASAQILGPKREPFTIEGRWDDRYNTPGFAVAEFRRFEEMFEKGNPVRVTFDERILDCIVTGLTPGYHRAAYITYSIVLDNYGPPRGTADRSPTTIASPAQAFDEVNTVAQVLSFQHTYVPASALAGTSKQGVDASLRSMSANLNKLSDIIDTRQGVLKPIAEFKKTATMFRMVQGDAANVVTSLVSVRADTELGIKTAMTTLDFEAWSRGMRAQARLLVGTSRKAASGMEERGSPKGIGIYRPHKGESLYAISRRFYGTPFSWGIIYTRNGLTSLRLDGTERLIIPERAIG